MPREILARLPFPLPPPADITRSAEGRKNGWLARACPYRRADRDDRLRLDRQGHPAADRAPFQLRQEPLRGHRPRGQGSQAAGRAWHPLRPSGRHQGQLPPPAHPAAHRRRRPGLLRQPVGRHLLARHHGTLPRDRRALYRHRGRALDRLLLRSQRSGRRRAPTTCCAKPFWPPAASARAGSPRCPAAAPIPAWCPGWSNRR